MTRSRWAGIGRRLGVSAILVLVAGAVAAPVRVAGDRPSRAVTSPSNADDWPCSTTTRRTRACLPTRLSVRPRRQRACPEVEDAGGQHDPVDACGGLQRDPEQDPRVHRDLGNRFWLSMRQPGPRCGPTPRRVGQRRIPRPPCTGTPCTSADPPTTRCSRSTRRRAPCMQLRDQRPDLRRPRWSPTSAADRRSSSATPD